MFNTQHLSQQTYWFTFLQATTLLLCGHPIGCITHLARTCVCPHVCPVWAPNSITKNRKIKTGTNIPQGTWSASLQMKRSKVKVTGGQKPPHQSGVTFTYGQPIEHPLLRHRLQGGRGLEFPSNMQHAAAERTAATAACHVGADISACFHFCTILCVPLFSVLAWEQSLTGGTSHWLRYYENGFLVPECLAAAYYNSYL